MEHAQKIGLLGEINASRFLREKGYNILAANYSTKTGEIDLVAGKDDVCVFVEVKSRSENSLFSPSDAVDYQKEERVKSTAAAFISANKIKLNIRFDIIEVYFTDNAYTINHIENAF